MLQGDARIFPGIAVVANRAIRMTSQAPAASVAICSTRRTNFETEPMMPERRSALACSSAPSMSRPRLVLGGLIDRGGATRLVPMISVPFAASLLAILLSAHPLVPLVYLGLFGVTIGMLQPVTSAMLAERYGVANLGGIRSMSTAVTVMAAAVAPFTTGWLLDASVSVSAMMIGFLAYVAVTTVAAWVVLSRRIAD